MNTKRIIAEIKAKQKTMDNRMTIFYTILIFMPMGFPIILTIEFVKHLIKKHNGKNLFSTQRNQRTKLRLR